MNEASAQSLQTKGVTATALRIAHSALVRDSAITDLAQFHRWFADFGQQAYTRVTRVPLNEIVGWSSDPDSGDLRHDSGEFFTVEGVEVRIPAAPVAQWSQPIIRQPEVGILGILIKEFDGVLHLLLQAKVEPGNCNGLQLSPTVQATRSNYTQVHRGKPVPYLDYFRDVSARRVIADVRQSEQGAWFHQKRNRNMVVEVTGDVEVLDGFCWLTLGQVHQLLAIDNQINMDARTVLSCLPFGGSDLTTVFSVAGDDFVDALIRSCNEEPPGADNILSWITEARTRTDVFTKRVPLNSLPHWDYADGKLSHQSGRFFDVIGISVTARGREVNSWMQPMIEPHGIGVVAFLVRRIRGVLHALVNARVEPGYVDVVELAPTVQCTPENYDSLPAAARPQFLEAVLAARPQDIRFEAVLSEEGGRFYRARNRYLIVETDLDVADDHPHFRWMTLHQLVDLLRHSHYVNVQARSLVACLHSLTAGACLS